MTPKTILQAFYESSKFAFSQFYRIDKPLFYFIIPSRIIMNSKGKLTKSAILVSASISMAGILLIAISELPYFSQGFLSELLKIVGAAILSVFSITILFQLIIGDKLFKSSLQDQFALMDNLQSRAFSFGIKEIFADRMDFEQKHPLESILPVALTDKPIFVVARAPHVFLSHEQIVREIIIKGCDLRISFLSRTPHGNALNTVAKLTSHHRPATDHTIILLKKLAISLNNVKPSGKLTVTQHELPLLDSMLAIPRQDGYTLIWDLSFGAINQKKRIFLLETRPGNFAEDLFNRYRAIYELGEDVLRFNNGAIELDKLNELIPEENLNEYSVKS